MTEVSEKIKVLFVCFGNTCRSPMAEAIFKDLVKKKGTEEKFIVDSAALSKFSIKLHVMMKFYVIDFRFMASRI